MAAATEAALKVLTRKSLTSLRKTDANRVPLQYHCLFPDLWRAKE